MGELDILVHISPFMKIISVFLAVYTLRLFFAHQFLNAVRAARKINAFILKTRTAGTQAFSSPKFAKKVIAEQFTVITCETK